MRIIVIRHAERVEGKATPTTPLTPAGRVGAVETGRWLHAYGVRPALVGYTATVRTQDTAELVLEGMGLATGDAGVPVLPPEPMPQELGAWRTRVAAIRRALGDRADDADVLLCVHSRAQEFVEDTFGGRALGVPVNNRGSAFVLEVDASGGARCVGAWLGHPKA